MQRLVLSTSFLLAACLVSLHVAGRTPAPPKPGPGCAPPPESRAVINVKSKGAKGDGRTDDTAAIQASIHAVPRGGTVFIPDGTYMLDAAGEDRLQLKSEMTLRLSPHATLKAIPTASEKYALLTIRGAFNVTIVGGTLEGERDAHMGDIGQAGIGLRVDQGSENVIISGVTAKKMWADGFYIQDAKNVRLCGVVADSNRRQGLSIIQADGVVVSGSVFQDTSGTRPSAGIDIEPDRQEQAINNVRIERSHFLRNAGAGVEINAKKGPATGIEIARNVFDQRRPILVRGVDKSPSLTICENRYLTNLPMPGDGLYAFGDQVQTSISQDDAGLVLPAEATASCSGHRKTAND